jgi:hypothetical protein
VFRDIDGLVKQTANKMDLSDARKKAPNMSRKQLHKITENKLRSRMRKLQLRLNIEQLKSVKREMRNNELATTLADFDKELERVVADCEIKISTAVAKKNREMDDLRESHKRALTSALTSKDAERQALRDSHKGGKDTAQKDLAITSDGDALPHVGHELKTMGDQLAANFTTKHVDVEAERDAHIKALEDKNAELKVLHDRIASVRQQSEAENRELNVKHVTELTLKNKSIESLRAQGKAFNNQTGSLQADTKAKDTIILSFQAQVHAKHTEIASLKSQLASAMEVHQEQQGDLQKQMKAFSDVHANDLQRLRDQITSQAREIKKQRQDNENLRKALASSSNRAPIVTSKTPVPSKLLQENEELKQALAHKTESLQVSYSEVDEMKKEWRDTYDIVQDVNGGLPRICERFGKKLNACGFEIADLIEADPDRKSSFLSIKNHVTNFSAVKVKPHEISLRIPMQIRRARYELETIFEHHNKFLRTFGTELRKKYPGVDALAASVLATGPASVPQSAPLVPILATTSGGLKGFSKYANIASTPQASLSSSALPQKPTPQAAGTSVKPAGSIESSMSVPAKSPGGLMGYSKYADPNYVPKERKRSGLETMANKKK